MSYLACLYSCYSVFLLKFHAERNKYKAENETNNTNTFSCFAVACLKPENDIDSFIFIKISKCNAFVFSITVKQTCMQNFDQPRKHANTIIKIEYCSSFNVPSPTYSVTLFLTAWKSANCKELSPETNVCGPIVQGPNSSPDIFH